MGRQTEAAYGPACAGQHFHGDPPHTHTQPALPVLIVAC